MWFEDRTSGQWIIWSVNSGIERKLNHWKIFTVWAPWISMKGKAFFAYQPYIYSHDSNISGYIDYWISLSVLLQKNLYSKIFRKIFHFSNKPIISYNYFLYMSKITKNSHLPGGWLHLIFSILIVWGPSLGEVKWWMSHFEWKMWKVNFIDLMWPSIFLKSKVKYILISRLS